MQQSLKKIQEVQPGELSHLLKSHYTDLMAVFYEMQSEFLTGIYKRYNGIQTANIILCFAKNTHLEIIRQREKNLNFDISLDKFWDNFTKVTRPLEKISDIVNYTKIPKETVRRKIKNLVNEGSLLSYKNTKGYAWNIMAKEKDHYFKIVSQEIKFLAKFISKFSYALNLNLETKVVEKEIRSQFSFYWFHFLSCQLDFLKIYQLKIKDTDLLLIILQALIPVLQYVDKKSVKNTNLEDLFQIIGKTNEKYDLCNASITATAVSEITAIPRATCIRKLEKLVLLGFLNRATGKKGYCVNQDINGRTKNILSKDNVNFTIEIFSQYLAIIFNSLIFYKK